MVGPTLQLTLTQSRDTEPGLTSLMEAAGHLFLSLSSRVRSGGTRWGGRATRLLLDIYLARLLAGDYTECRHSTTTPYTRTARLAGYRWDGVFTVYISQILQFIYSLFRLLYRSFLKYNLETSPRHQTYHVYIVKNDFKKANSGYSVL